MSTPVRGRRSRPKFRLSPLQPRGPRLSARDWSFMPGRRNRRRRRNLQKRISYSDAGEMTLIPETNKKKTGLRWKAVDSYTFKFVDDGIIVTKANMDSAQAAQADAQMLKVKHDVQTQNLFRRIVRRAESTGTVINKGKTKVLCISDAQSYTAGSFLLDSDGGKNESGGSMKVLGYHLDGRPSAPAMWRPSRKE